MPNPKIQIPSRDQSSFWIWALGFGFWDFLEARPQDSDSKPSERTL